MTVVPLHQQECMVNQRKMAELLGVSEGTLRNWRRQYGMPHHRIGPKLVRYLPSEAMRWAATMGMTS